ncbi:GroES-like protein [Hypomontagnella submonticulosa]|nr:GroES-like protein [Hypomontagnella submonticulosa]
MSATVNRAFWQDKIDVPSVIRESPVPSKVDDGEILIKVQAWGMNPVDGFLQHIALPFITYPLIPGEDIAGTVELVGAGAAASHQKFKAGDRVFGFATRAFQDYVVLDHAMVVKIPDAMTFAEAAVFPLCLATAAHALFAKDYLHLPFPQVSSSGGSSSSSPSAAKAVLIWGGASGVGSNAIQLAKAVGYHVLTTCSPRNFDYVRGLGADKVFDYHSATVVEDLVAEIDARVCAGIFQAAGPHGAVGPCCQVAHKSKQTLFVACANAAPEGAVPQGVQATFVYDTNPKGFYYDTCSVLFADFLPRALASGEYKVAPTPEVVPTRGVAGIQEALDIVKKGVSAKKIIVVAE